MNIYRLVDWFMMLPEDFTKKFTKNLNFNKLHITAFATFARKWDFSPAKTLRNRRG